MAPMPVSVSTSCAPLRRYRASEDCFSAAIASETLRALSA